ncbi:MAG TPA: PqqD family protein [Candidatus Polarisedimenticolaceae bacterium]|nr:PqqD family protein [Candidatus Polarisedimenticolaceae bacterium]
MENILGMRAVAAERVLVKEVGDEAVLLDLDTETYFGLNAAGARIFTAVTAARTIGDALAGLAGAFDADPAVVRDDAIDLVRALALRKLLRLVDA